VRVDVLFGSAGISQADVHGRVLVMIDVLRASTTIAVALSNGAKNVIPFDSAEEVILRSKSFERSDVRLAGERKMLTIPGFDFGNSPREYTREAVEGKSILFSTTNGTGALVSIQGARDVAVGAYVNYSAVLAMVRAAIRGKSDVSILCAGRERQFALEDAACAGRYVRGILRRLANVEINDAGRACALIDRRFGADIERLFRECDHGRALVEAGFEDDLALCAAVDAYPIIPIYQDRQIVKLGPRER
jgi:2-phosphosulfolactate phosphatase